MSREKSWTSLIERRKSLANWNPSSVLSMMTNSAQMFFKGWRQPRGSINSLMAELMEDHIRNHMPGNSKSSEEAADDLIDIVRTYVR